MGPFWLDYPESGSVRRTEFIMSSRARRDPMGIPSHEWNRIHDSAAVVKVEKRLHALNLEFAQFRSLGS